jgi:hypothetical protein
MAMSADEREAQAEGKGDKAKTKAAFYRNQRNNAEETGDQATTDKIYAKIGKKSHNVDSARGDKAILGTVAATAGGGAVGKGLGMAAKGAAETGAGKALVGAAKSKMAAMVPEYEEKIRRTVSKIKSALPGKKTTALPGMKNVTPGGVAKKALGASKATAKLAGQKALKGGVPEKAGPMQPTRTRRESRIMRENYTGKRPAANTKARPEPEPKKKSDVVAKKGKTLRPSLQSRAGGFLSELRDDIFGKPKVKNSQLAHNIEEQKSSLAKNSNRDGGELEKTLKDRGSSRPKEMTKVASRDPKGKGTAPGGRVLAKSKIKTVGNSVNFDRAPQTRVVKKKVG